MAQRGAKLGHVERINTLKGWARGLGMEIPLTPKPTTTKKKTFNKKR